MNPFFFTNLTVYESFFTYLTAYETFFTYLMLEFGTNILAQLHGYKYFYQIVIFYEQLCNLKWLFFGNFQTDQSDELLRPKRIQTLRARVDLGVIAMNEWLSTQERIENQKER